VFGKWGECLYDSGGIDASLGVGMVSGVKALILLLVVVLVGCASTPVNPNWVSNPNDPNNVKIEKAIRQAAEKLTGELTEADLEKVTELNLVSKRLTSVKGMEELTQLRVLNLRKNQLTDVKSLEKLTQLEVLVLGHNQLTDVKGLEKLTKLKGLDLDGNPDLTKAQIDELQKAFPKCDIYSNPTK